MSIEEIVRPVTDSDELTVAVNVAFAPTSEREGVIEAVGAVLSTVT